MATKPKHVPATPVVISAHLLRRFRHRREQLGFTTHQARFGFSDGFVDSSFGLPFAS